MVDLEFLIMILGIIALCAFVLGVFLILNGAKNAPDIKKIVPIDQLNIVQEELHAQRSKEDELKLQLDKLVVELDQTRDQLKSTSAAEEDRSQLRRQEQIYLVKIEALERDLNFIQGKADLQARESIEVISSLSESNELLKEQIDQAKERIDPSALEILKNEKIELEQKIEQNAVLVGKLSGELNAMRDSSRAEIAAVNKNLEDINSENSILKDGVRKIAGRIVEVQQAISVALEDNDKLLAEAQSRILEFEEESRKLEFEKQANKLKIKGLEEDLLSFNKRIGQAVPARIEAEES